MNAPVLRWRVIASRANWSQPASSVESASSTLAIVSSRNRPVSSLTPRKRDPPPSKPAASAPWVASGALSHVSRDEMEVGVKPWSASATSTALNIADCPAVGPRSVLRGRKSVVVGRWEAIGVELGGGGKKKK